jgi:hypothetical protein
MGNKLGHESGGTLTMPSSSDVDSDTIVMVDESLLAASGPQTRRRSHVDAVELREQYEPSHSLMPTCKTTSYRGVFTTIRS